VTVLAYKLYENTNMILFLKGNIKFREDQEQVILRPMVSRPVHLGAVPLSEQVTRFYIYFCDNYFRSFSCRAPSLTSGRVCSLQCNDASSSYIATGGLSATSSWCRAPNGAHDLILISIV
jgi:hypothetical protein